MIKRLLGAIAFVASSLLLMGQTTEPFPGYINGLATASTPLSGAELTYLLQSSGSRSLPVQTLTGNTLPLVVNSLGAASPLVGTELMYLTQSSVSKNVTPLTLETQAIPLANAAAPAATLSGTELFGLSQGGVYKTATTTAISNFTIAAAGFPAGPAGILQNILNVQTSNYNVATTDCSKTIFAGTGATGFFTVTLPAVAGFPTNCVINIKNGDTGRGKGLSGFPSDVNTILYPLQTLEVGIVNGAWATLQYPGRWRPTSAPTFFVDGSLGNDANDGLASGTGNAFLTIGQAAKIVSSAIDTGGGGIGAVTISLASGQTWTNTTVELTVLGRSNVILNANSGTLTGNLSNGAAVAITCLGQGVPNTPGISGTACLTIENATVTCSSGAAGLQMLNGTLEIGTGMTFGACGTGFQLYAAGSQAAIQSSVGYTISGGGGAHFFGNNGGFINFINPSAITITLTGTPAFSSAFAYAETGAKLTFVNNVFSGSATGIRYAAQHSGVIYTSGAGPNFFPGSTPGLISRGGSYDSPGTPTVSSGCGGGSISAISTDMVGAIIWGGTSQSTCVVQFTSSNLAQDTSCVASSSTGVSGAIFVAVNVGLNQMTIGLTNAITGGTIGWSCPSN